MWIWLLMPDTATGGLSHTVGGEGGGEEGGGVMGGGRSGGGEGGKPGGLGAEGGEGSAGGSGGGDGPGVKWQSTPCQHVSKSPSEPQRFPVSRLSHSAGSVMSRWLRQPGHDPGPQLPYQCAVCFEPSTPSLDAVGEPSAADAELFAPYSANRHTFCGWISPARYLSSSKDLLRKAMQPPSGARRAKPTALRVLHSSLPLEGLACTSDARLAQSDGDCGGDCGGNGGEGGGGEGDHISLHVTPPSIDHWPAGHARMVSEASAVACSILSSRTCSSMVYSPSAVAGVSSTWTDEVFVGLAKGSPLELDLHVYDIR